MDRRPQLCGHRSVLRLYVAVILEDRQPEAESKYALEAARRYHQWTVSELMSYLEQAAAKNGCTLVAVDPLHTTGRCTECGELSLIRMRMRRGISFRK